MNPTPTEQTTATGRVVVTCPRSGFSYVRRCTACGTVQGPFVPDPHDRKSPVCHDCAFPTGTDVEEDGVSVTRCNGHVVHMAGFNGEARNDGDDWVTRKPGSDVWNWAPSMEAARRRVAPTSEQMMNARNVKNRMNW